MTFLGDVAQRAFEERKDDGQVQALLTLLGNKWDQASEWEVTSHVQDANYATFRVAFQDESEARGYIMFVPQHDKWIAGGAMIPAYQAKRIAAMNVWLSEYGPYNDAN